MVGLEGERLEGYGSGLDSERCELCAVKLWRLRSRFSRTHLLDERKWSAERSGQDECRAMMESKVGGSRRGVVYTGKVSQKHVMARRRSEEVGSVPPTLNEYEEPTWRCSVNYAVGRPSSAPNTP